MSRHKLGRIEYTHIDIEKAIDLVYSDTAGRLRIPIRKVAWLKSAATDFFVKDMLSEVEYTPIQNCARRVIASALFDLHEHGHFRYAVFADGEISEFEAELSKL